MKDLIKFRGPMYRGRLFSRREVLKAAGTAGILATLPISLIQKSLAAQMTKQEKSIPKTGIFYPDWLTEARLGGLSISGVIADSAQIGPALDQAVRQGVTVIEADSQLSDYVPEKDFAIGLQLIKETTKLIHDRGMRVVWYLPALEVITPDGRIRKDSFARTHPNWLQVSFDGESRAYFFGQKVFWVTQDDESAWLCPNSPYREWFKKHLRLLANTGVDGIWLDVPIFDQIVIEWGCSCKYCREKFLLQTGMEFPERFDVADQRLWRWIQWRHETLTEFLQDCKKAIESSNPDVVTIAEIVAPDHLGATRHGTEGSQLHDLQVVWEVQAMSETTAMAEAGYDDWIIMHNIYKYCRGAAMDRPSWALSYGYSDSDAQLVMSSAIAAQNNAYELRTPEMTTSVGMEFRQLMFNWISQHSEQIYRSDSLAPVAVVYSERNRDFLDAVYDGGVYLNYVSPGRDRNWLANKEGSPLRLEYMGDYRGLSVFLYQHQIPTDIYPFSRVDVDLLKKYRVLVLPYMAILTEDEREILLKVVRDGATLIVSGPEPGMWDAEARPRENGLWSDFIGESKDDRLTRSLGKGRICFWRDHVGRKYLKTHSDTITTPLLTWIKKAGVDPWINTKQPVVVQPYIYQHQIIIHVLNYSWIGALENRPKPISLELTIPWDANKKVKRIIQSEPQWSESKPLSYSKRGNKMIIPIQIGINALVLIDT
jgi:hypothetical protein